MFSELTVAFHETFLVGATFIASSLVTQSRRIVGVCRRVRSTAWLLLLLVAHRQIQRHVLIRLIRCELTFRLFIVLVLIEIDARWLAKVHEDLRPMTDDDITLVEMMMIVHILRHSSTFVINSQIFFA